MIDLILGALCEVRSDAHANEHGGVWADSAYHVADCDDESMMFGQAEALLIRLSRYGSNPPYAASEVKSIIDALEKELF